ncbi:MAG: DUF2085 domain-containing protein [Anaerolineales bacterium]|nr:MAG: DUF2085 domain-containing protein [Anaerolineales bacterium]
MPSMTTETTSSNNRSLVILLNRAMYAFSRNWFFGIVVLTGVWVGLPWLAPVFMRLGWIKLADAIYFFYSFQCHQLPQRSFFLFGRSISYPLDQIQAAWNGSIDPIVLRHFNGDLVLGFKVAWSDRMVSAYTSIPLFALLWWPFRNRIRPIAFIGFVLLLLPMAIDGGTHIISDLAGIGQGFRDTNEWLFILTNHSLPSTFYVGDALGSFNSWMRLITGVLFGLGIVWFSFPYFQEAFEDSAKAIEAKFTRAEVE